jgi:hypothetical protein
LATQVECRPSATLTSAESNVTIILHISPTTEKTLENISRFFRKSKLISRCGYPTFHRGFEAPRKIVRDFSPTAGCPSKLILRGDQN